MTNPKPVPHKRPLYQNWVSQLGMLVALGGSVVTAVLILVQLADPTANPYIGMFTYMLLPGMIVTGFALILGACAGRLGAASATRHLQNCPIRASI